MFWREHNERSRCLPVALLVMVFLVGLPSGTGQAQTPASDEGTWTHFDVHDDDVQDNIDDIAVAHDGNIWISITDGSQDVAYFDGESWISVPHSEQLAGACWTHANIAPAPDGTVWLGACGPNHFDGERWTVYISSQGGGGIFRDMEEFTVIVNDQDTPPSNGVGALITTSDGTVWLAPEGAGVGGVLRFDGETWTAYTEDDGLISNQVHTLALAPDDSLWVGTGHGLSHFDGEHWTNYPEAAGLQSLSLDQLAVTPDGTVWGTAAINGQSSLFWFDGVEVNTLSSLETVDAQVIWTVAAAPDGVIWVGTDTGISKYDGERWANYRLSVESAGRVYAPGVLNLAFAPDGSIWCGTQSGVYRFVPPDH